MKAARRERRAASGGRGGTLARRDANGERHVAGTAADGGPAENAYVTGNVTENSVPSASLLVTSSEPPCSSAMD